MQSIESSQRGKFIVINAYIKKKGRSQTAWLYTSKWEKSKLGPQLAEGFAGGWAVKNPSAKQEPQAGRLRGRRAQQPTQLFLSGESHGQTNLEVYDPEGCKESDMAKAT